MKINSAEGFGDVSLVAGLRGWFETPPGSLIADVERRLLGRFLPDLFGFHLVQLGCHHLDGLLDGSRIGHKVHIDLGHTLNAKADMHCIEDALPLAPNSVDVIVLPHVLEYAVDARRVLRETERVLIGEGHLVILGFNPWSWFGLWSLLTRWRGLAPWHGRFIGTARLNDWLKLLGFDILHVERHSFRPPIRSEAINRHLEPLERLGAFCWPLLGNVYLIVARKRVEGLTPLRASWRQRRRLVAANVVEPSTRVGLTRVAGSDVDER
jgi:SAM-dependent methyltransferase